MGTSDVPGEHLGNVLVRFGVLAQAQLEKATEILLRDRKRLGTVLAELGIVPRERMTEAVGLHVREILFNVMDQPGGSCVFEETGADSILGPDLTVRIAPGDDLPLVLPRTSEGLYLLQRVRDEAHRFAITHHRQKRSKAMTVSVLDEVPGLGPARKKVLLRAFGSVKRLRSASVEEIASVQGIGPSVAAAVVKSLGGAAAEPAVDMATGEIID